MSDHSSSSNSSLDEVLKTCFTSRKTILVFSAMSVTNLLLLPVFILVFYRGYNQWRQQRTSKAASSHSNVFTYHGIAMQLIEDLGLFLYFCGGYNSLGDVAAVGVVCMFVSSFGLALFHILTCVEHFLAVAHAITYLHLKQAGEVRIRTACVVCVWLLSSGSLVLSVGSSSTVNSISYLCFMGFSLIIISFCSLSALSALKRTGPGEVGGARKQVDQSKRRAFHTILAIMQVLLFRFVGNLIVVCGLTTVDSDHVCVALLSMFWLELPSSLVLPVLFLQRTGKLKCCKQKLDSG